MSKARKPAAKSASTATSPKKSKSNETVELVRELATILNRRNLAELVVELPEATITLRSGRADTQQVTMTVPPPQMQLPPAPPPALAAAPPAAAPVADDDGPAESGNGKYQIVTSPFVGTFYRSPGPDADPFVEVGARIEKGQVLCIVEAMKLMNEIEAEYTGVIAAVLVENAQSVEYGQPLFKISAG